MGFFSNIFGKSREQRKAEQLAQAEKRAEDQQSGGLGLTSEFSIFNQKQNGALAISSVFAAIEMISNGVAMMPIDVKSKSAHQTPESLYLNNIFTRNLISRYNLIKQMTADVLLYGNGYALIQRSSCGEPTGLKYVPSKNVNIVYKEINQELYYRVQGYVKPIYPQEILHVYKNSKDGVTGVSVLNYAHRSVDLSNYAEAAALDYYKKGLNFQGIIHATNMMTKNQAEQAIKSVNGNMVAGSATYKFIPFDLKLESLSHTAQEASLVDTRVYNTEDIARYFNLPVPMLTKDNNGNSGLNLQFLTQTLTPYVIMFEEEFNRKLAAGTDLYFDFDERILLRNDSVNTANYLNQMVSIGIMSVNEARDVIGLPRVEGGNDLRVAYTDVNQNVVATGDEN